MGKCGCGPFKIHKKKVIALLRVITKVFLLRDTNFSPLSLSIVLTQLNTWCARLFDIKGMVLYSAVSSPLDRSKRFTLSSPGRPVHSDTVLGFSWKHSSHAAIAQRLFTHISTTVYSQVLIYTAESTEAS